jgi:hypothetical protein
MGIIGPATTGFRRLDFCRRADEINYRFLTPRKQKTEFRKQETEGSQNCGVEIRQLAKKFLRRKTRRQNPAVADLTPFFPTSPA